MIRLLALILVSLGLMTAEAEEQRIALLIGNQSYDTDGLSPLTNPHGDVERVAAALRQSGFADVTVLKDQNEPQMREAIMAFAEKLRIAGGEGIGFFYYSGHGAALETEDRTRVSYLIPTGEPVSYAEQLESYGVPLTEQVDRLSSTGAGAVFVVIDACRNTLSYRFRKSSAVKGIANVSAPGGLLIAYAAADGHWADDDSVFSTALAAELPKPGQTAETAFLNVSRTVGAKKPGINRLPVIQPRLSKTVCFNGCEAGVDLQLAAFGQIRDCAGARGFLERYPGSAYRVPVETMASGFCAAPIPIVSDTTQVDAAKSALDRGIDANRLQNYVAARKEFAIACDGGIVLGCGLLGAYIYWGHGGTQNIDEGLQIMRQACQDGNEHTCSELKRWKLSRVPAR